MEPVRTFDLAGIPRLSHVHASSESCWASVSAGLWTESFSTKSFSGTTDERLLEEDALMLPR
jgi:hypothetical protein